MVMPSSQANIDGLQDPARVVHGHWQSFCWEPLPEYDGSKSIYYRSKDGTIVAAAAKENGKSVLTYPCDEFFYVTKGWVTLSVHGGETFSLRPGDVAYFCKGTTVDIECGDDYTNIAVLIGDDKVTLL